MKYFFGLGNVGQQYQNTRHNVGHIFIDTLKGKEGDWRLDKNNGFMNESGLSAQKFVRFYKINLDNFYLVHDDLDLPIGEYRIQFDRGAAGHHGVESVIAHLGSKAFKRIRIGIGKPPEHVEVTDFVLRPFTKDEKVLISETIDKIIKEI